MTKDQKKLVRFLSEYSVPLIAGVIVAMAFANLNPDIYDHLVHSPVYSLFNAPEHAEHHAGHHGDAHGSHWDHYFTLHFLVNDIFMVFFFGIAAKEITEACLPGGALNPPSKAINPLCGTVGGVLGPVGVYLGLNAIVGQDSWANGWGIPTATSHASAMSGRGILRSASCCCLQLRTTRSGLESSHLHIQTRLTRRNGQTLFGSFQV